MTLTRREMILAWSALLALFTLVLAVTVSRRWEADRRLARERDGLARQVRAAERLLAGRSEAESRLDALRAQLPRHPAGRDVTADLLRDMEQLAREHGVTLTRREADRERPAGDLFEVSVTCSWEAELDGLMRFLYALEAEGRMRQIRHLTISPAREQRLRGTVIVDHAYVREPGTAPRAEQES